MSHVELSCDIGKQRLWKLEAYLEIARTVLRSSRRPMSARGILASAYRADIVPHHLHGKQQHKTLQARLSEDILKNKRNSVFYRTEPGIFFLTEFQADPDIPDKYRVPFPARRRTRDLLRGPILAVDRSLVPTETVGTEAWDCLRELARSNHLYYRDPKERTQDIAFLWTFAMVFRGSQVLSYRVGRYRDDRDNFANKRTVGFSNVVHSNYRTLFNQDDFGIIDSAITATLTDLDISATLDFFNNESNRPRLDYMRLSDVEGGSPSYVAFIRLECPTWFEPTSRRLSLNDIGWLDLSTRPNHMEDFDPWSQMAIEKGYEASSPR